MMKSLVLNLLLAAAGSVAYYPRYAEVVRDPKDFDLLYSSTSGPINETWRFYSEAILTSIIIPSQITFCSSDPGTDGTYDEEVDLLVYEKKIGRVSSEDETYLVATGSFNGTVSFGQELDIPLWNATLNSAPPVQHYFYSTGGYEYTVNIVFKKDGIYPWYTARNLSDYSVIDSRIDGSGIAIGLTYTLSYEATSTRRGS
ncbi:uncharacterized protein LOC126234330 [Schistocerca nitens]|uniref:uncharacterized protein LOC126234330 n=1 Tax=Schistocerca nitens TaxID=7011 RepID=UPI0021192D45|nr:uncharacterized protein LOC126234330 [Schistocerca nitens]